MAARGRVLKNSAGQSLIEFLIILPLMVGMVILMVRVNTAIQVSIVNQQYARAQALFVAYNSSVYPHLDMLTRGVAPYGYNQLVMGMSNEKIQDATDFTQGNDIPDAVVVSLSKKRGGSDDPQVEPELRSRVRVRTTVTLCTQNNLVRTSGGTYEPVLNLGDKKNGFPALSNHALAEGVVFDYCRAPEGTYSNEQ